jgi:DNA uptake protein ComE-like DNA-binding protein
MKQYILHRTFVTADGSAYHRRSKPYLECELPALALQPAFSTLVDAGTVIAVATVPERNVEEKHYNAIENKNVIEQTFEPKYYQPEEIVVPQPDIDLKHLNTPDHVVTAEAKVVVLGQSTVDDIAALPYISHKTAEKLVAALEEGRVFNSYEDLDNAFKLGFGKSWSATSLVLPQTDV